MTEPTPLDAVTADDLLLDRLAARLGSDHDDQLATMLLAAARQCDTALRPHQRSGRRRLGGRRTLTALAALGIAASGAGVAAAGEKSPPASAGGTVHSRVVEARPPAAGSGARVVLPRPQGPGATASLMPVGAAWVAVGPSASPSTVLVPAASPGDTSGGSGPSSATPQAVQRQQNAPVVEAQTVAAPVSQAHAVESPAVQRQVVDPFGVQFQIVAPAAARPRPRVRRRQPGSRRPGVRRRPPPSRRPRVRRRQPGSRRPRVRRRQPGSRRLRVRRRPPPGPRLRVRRRQPPGPRPGVRRSCRLPRRTARSPPAVAAPARSPPARSPPAGSPPAVAAPLAELATSEMVARHPSLRTRRPFPREVARRTRPPPPRAPPEEPQCPTRPTSRSRQAPQGARAGQPASAPRPVRERMPGALCIRSPANRRGQWSSRIWE